MKRIRLGFLLFVLIALLFIAGLVVLPVVLELRQEVKNRALIAAVRQDQDAAVISLLDDGADPNARNIPKSTRPFWSMCWDLLHGRHQKNVGYAPTALVIALNPDEHQISTYFPDISIVRALLQHGANPNVALDQDSASLIMHAIMDRDSQIQLLLIQHGAKLVENSGGKTTALFILAAMQAQTTAPCVLQAMLERGADIDSQDANGMTALMFTAKYEDNTNLRLLLAHHAHVAIKDHSGHTALYYADKYENSPEVSRTIDMLIRAGAR